MEEKRATTTLPTDVLRQLFKQGRERAGREAMERFNIPLLEMDARGFVRHVNKKTVTSFGVPREKLIGKHLREIIEEEPADHVGLVEEVMQHAREVKPGETRVVRPSLVIRRDPKGEPIETIARFTIYRPTAGEPKIFASMTHTRRVLEQSKLLKEFFDLADTINSQRDLDQLLQKVAERFAERFNATAIVLRPSEGNKLELAAFAGEEILPKDFLKFDNISFGKGLVGKAAETLQYQEVLNLLEWPESVNRELDQKYQFKHSVAVPLTVKGADGKPVLVGVIGVFKGGKHADEQFRPHELRMLKVLADNTATTIHNAELTRGLRRVAERDSLTGLYNRVVLFRRIRDYFNAFPPENPNFKLNLQNKRATIFYVDANNLKLLNDFHGYEAGDKGIKLIADTLKKHAPKDATVARVGGDEFVVFAPDIDLPASEEFKNKVLADLSERLKGEEEMRFVNFGATVNYKHFGAGGQSREEYQNLLELPLPESGEESAEALKDRLLSLAEERMKKYKKKREETHLYVPQVLRELARKAATRQVTPQEERIILKTVMEHAGKTVLKQYASFKREAVKQAKKY
ncbi:MAG: diguanylate cyclase domain-containing protein [Candidatus Micrarchaeia archaeon]|jgi:diguanylate cyclase (GGDEF)-like protein/PAS domain S-box-containing protein